MSAYLRTHKAHTVKEAAGKRALAEGECSPFRERPVGGRGGGGGGGGAGGGREEEEDVLRKEERVGRAEDGVLSSTREAALRRTQVAEEERELRERLRRFNGEADALDAKL